MSKILNLVIMGERGLHEPEIFVESFAVRDNLQQPEEALRLAIKEFINSGTKEAEAAITYARGCFNWGDAISLIPKSVFTKHGLTMLNQDSVDVFVNHDEILL